MPSSTGIATENLLNFEVESSQTIQNLFYLVHEYKKLSEMAVEAGQIDQRKVEARTGTVQTIYQDS